MKKTIVRVSAFAVALLLIAAALIVALVPQREAKASTTKTMDIFIIAGQSNAAGESYVGNVKGTFPNVLYAGEAGPNPNVTTSTQSVTNVTPGACYDVTWPFNPVKQGLGSNGGCLGPEFGMAKFLNNVYTAENPCMILKTATGAVGLYRDHTKGNYDPDGRQSTTRIGFLYRRLLENLTAVKNSLAENGYTANVKAFIWMQGENEMTGGASVYSSYATEFKKFADYMRIDIGNIIGKTEAQMKTDMPFIIGEVALNGGEGRDGYNTQRGPAFVAIQRTIPDLVDNARLINSSSFATDVANGNPWHWSGSDMVTIGEMFARSALGDKAFDYVEYGTTKNGGVIPELSADETQMTFTVYPTEGYKLTKFTVNGTDVTNQLVDGKYTVAHSSSNRYVVTVECVALSRCTITNNYVPASAYVDYGDAVQLGTSGQRYVLEGEMLEFSFEPKKNYSIGEVKVNGTVVTPTVTDGKYYYTYGPVTEDVTIEMSATKTGAGGTTSGGDQTPDADETGGCGKESLALALSSLGALALAAFVIKK